MTDERAARLIEAMSKYRELASSHYDEVLDQVSRRIAESGSVGKLDIAALTTWKRVNASTTWVMHLMSLPDSEVRVQTEAAVAIANETRDVIEAADGARRALRELPGCGPVSGAMPSAILTAAAPGRFAIYDRRTHTAMNRLGITLGNKDIDLYRRYITEVEALRHELQVHETNWTARDVDLALYQLGGKTSPGDKR